MPDPASTAATERSTADDPLARAALLLIDVQRGMDDPRTGLRDNTRAQVLRTDEVLARVRAAGSPGRAG